MASNANNEQIVRMAFDAYFRGDQPSLFALVADDVLVTQFADQLDVRDYHGHDGLMQVMAEWIGAWEDWSIAILRARSIGEHVVVAARQQGRGRGSGVPMDAEVSFVFTLRGGKITRWRMFHSEQEALEVAQREQDVGEAQRRSDS